MMIFKENIERLGEGAGLLGGNVLLYSRGRAVSSNGK